VAAAGGCAVAGCAGLLWLLAGGVLPVPPLAAGRGVAADRYRPRHRAVATRFDKLAVRYEATLHIATINDWLLTSL
jgi:hypothetical protein